MLSLCIPGHGPFPGVLDMFGTVGGLIEFRAAMLANKGFITFALCYMSSHEVEEIETSYLQVFNKMKYTLYYRLLISIKILHDTNLYV